jgi:hypothetical protein
VDKFIARVEAEIGGENRQTFKKNKINEDIIERVHGLQ